jgi:hypothetical protein
MLLKIEKYDEGQDWWILDDIRKISKAQFSQPTGKDFSSEEADIFILDYIGFMNADGQGQSHRDVIKLVCRTSNGSEFTVLFDTIAYLLNDNGKTIEKLVANYR